MFSQISQVEHNLQLSRTSLGEVYNVWQIFFSSNYECAQRTGANVNAVSKSTLILVLNNGW